ncbi:MAG: adenylate/guanylate cyclase domain-containing protein [Actinomycetota bacterium]
MSRHKLGTVTLLFTDLVGSTELLEALGDDEADHLRRVHFRLLRESLAAFGGHEVKNLGDGLMVVFTSAVDAVACSIRMQQAVHHHNENNPELPLQVRIGLHGGDALQEEDDYFGRPVVIAKRLCDSAQGGQILVSELVQNLVGSRGRYEFKDLGWIALKGVATPMPAREVMWEPGDELPPPEEPEPIAVVPAAAGRRAMMLGAVAVAVVVVAVVSVVVLSGDGADEEPTAPGSLAALTWERSDDLGGKGDQAITRIAVGVSELVAVGYDGTRGDLDAAVWKSGDGLDWTPVRHSEKAFGGPGNEVMWAVKRFEPEQLGFNLIAVGQDAAGDDRDAAVWTSDGFVWERVKHSEFAFGGPGDQVMNRVEPAPLDVVAVGYDDSGGDRDAAVWTSRDGIRWAPSAPDEAVFGGQGDQDMRSVIAYGSPELVAVGYDNASGDADAAVWTSDDGVTWHRNQVIFGGTGDQQMLTVDQRKGRLIAVGLDSSGGDEDAAVWTSTNGVDWKRVPDDQGVFGGTGDQTMFGVEAFAHGFVAVGRDGEPREYDAAIWTSADGLSWTRVKRDDLLFGGEGNQTIKWVIATEERLVAGGWDGSGGDLDAAVWTADLP